MTRRGDSCGTSDPSARRQGSEGRIWSGLDRSALSIYKLLPLSCLLLFYQSTTSLMEPVTVPSRCVSFLSFRDHLVERFVKAGLDLVALTFAASALAQAPGAPGLETVFLGSGGRWNGAHCGRKRSWRDAGLRRGRCRSSSLGIDFKVPHALFALDAGAVRDEVQVIRWDGVKRDFDGWNQDQTLRSSMRHSTVWVYHQQFAREIGEVREKEYLTRIQYGNADPSGGVDRFWLDGALRISAMEQVDFTKLSKRASVQGRASASGQGYHGSSRPGAIGS